MIGAGNNSAANPNRASQMPPLMMQKSAPKVLTFADIKNSFSVIKHVNAGFFWIPPAMIRDPIKDFQSISGVWNQFEIACAGNRRLHLIKGVYLSDRHPHGVVSDELGHCHHAAAFSGARCVCRSRISIVMCSVSSPAAAIRASAGQCLAGMPSLDQLAMALRWAASSECRANAVGPPSSLTMSAAERGFS